jgi:MFS family permease
LFVKSARSKQDGHGDDPKNGDKVCKYEVMNNSENNRYAMRETMFPRLNSLKPSLSWPMCKVGSAVQNVGNISKHTARNLFTRDFGLGFLAYFVFLFACFALIPTLPIYLARLGSDEREIGVLVGIFSVSSLVSRLLVGGALFRYSEKSIMKFAALLFATTFPACLVFSPFWPFFVVRIFQGVAYACFDTAVFALIVKVTPPAYRGRALSYFMLAIGIATVMAPTSGMFFVNQFSFAFLFLICMGVSLCSLLFSGTLKGPEIAKPDSSSTDMRDTFFLELKIIVPAMSAFLHNFVLGSITAFFSLYAIQCGIKNPGYFFSASAVMVITGRALGGKILDTWSKEKIILTFILTSVVAMVILSFSTTLLMFIFVGLLWGTGVAFIFPVSMAYALDYAGSSHGTALSTFRALMDFGMALGPMTMGLIIPLMGYRAMFLCLALTCFINMSYFQFYVRKKRKYGGSLL